MTTSTSSHPTAARSIRSARGWDLASGMFLAVIAVAMSVAMSSVWPPRATAEPSVTSSGAASPLPW